MALEGQAARAYVAAFLRHGEVLGQLGGGRVFVGRDFRESSPGILRDCVAAVEAAGLAAVDCGALPTPALALHAMAAGCAAVMVTGSHIPEDRNGLKFYLPTGEISKADEAGIVAALRDAVIGDALGPVVDERHAAMERYFSRYSGLLADGALVGLRVGVFEHSSVARDVLVRVLECFGATVMRLGRAERFVAVDTEAVGDAVFLPVPAWVAEHGLDALVSADGDGDRPLLVDAQGQFVRGDVLGLLTAWYLGARTVVTPVTSSSGIEKAGAFEVVRTRVGSPYVIAAMEAAAGPVVGFEANGGTFVGEGIVAHGRPLAALATRDAVLPILSVLGMAAERKIGVAQLVAELALPWALADRLQHVSAERSARFLERLVANGDYARASFGAYGIGRISTVDGVQIFTAAGDVVHFRASGNAPELRCYVEGRTPEIAAELLAFGLRVAASETAQEKGPPFGDP
ncbi:phosphomannomutase [Devosia sp. 2618]